MTPEQEAKFYRMIVRLMYLYDPAYLNDSAPEDEYAPEAVALMAHPDSFGSRDALAEAIHQVCAEYIGADNIAPRDDALYRELAGEILLARDVAGAL